MIRSDIAPYDERSDDSTVREKNNSPAETPDGNTSSRDDMAFSPPSVLIGRAARAASLNIGGPYTLT